MFVHVTSLLSSFHFPCVYTELDNFFFFFLCFVHWINSYISIYVCICAVQVPWAFHSSYHQNTHWWNRIFFLQVTCVIFPVESALMCQIPLMQIGSFSSTHGDLGGNKWGAERMCSLWPEHGKCVESEQWTQQMTGKWRMSPHPPRPQSHRNSEEPASFPQSRPLSHTFLPAHTAHGRGKPPDHTPPCPAWAKEQLGLQKETARSPRLLNRQFIVCQSSTDCWRNSSNPITVCFNTGRLQYPKKSLTQVQLEWQRDSGRHSALFCNSIGKIQLLWSRAVHGKHKSFSWQSHVTGTELAVAPYIHKSFIFFPLGPALSHNNIIAKSTAHSITLVGRGIWSSVFKVQAGCSGLAHSHSGWTSPRVETPQPAWVPGPLLDNCHGDFFSYT